MGGLGDGGDFGGGGRDVPLGPAAVDPDVRAADSGASGLPGREEIAEAEPQAVDFPSAVLRIVTCSASYWSATPLVTNSSRARRLPLRGMKQARPA